MRNLRTRGGTLMVLALVLSGCSSLGGAENEAEQALDDINVVDEANLNEIMLTIGDPREAVTYFRNASAENPERLDLKRGLAESLVRADRPREAVSAWKDVTAHPDATNEDRVALADALIRSNQWDEAATTLGAVPPTHETYRRYRLAAMIADSREEWERADSFYETAAGMTTQPANVLNNWGYSKLSRGDHAAAERLFGEALQYDRDMFTAKNNLVLSRAAQRNYKLPVVPMTQTEKARLLHTMALGAIRQNDVATGRGLLEEAVDTHPQYFEEAARALEALERDAAN